MRRKGKLSTKKKIEIVCKERDQKEPMEIWEGQDWRNN